MITLLSTGSNAHGQLGNNSLDDSHIFQPCSFTNHPPNSLPPETSAVLNVVSGANHTLVLLELVDQVGLKKTELWGCGDGRAGQLGKTYREESLTGSSTSKFRKIELFLAENGLSGYSYRLISASWETSYAVLSCSGKGDVVISLGSDDFGDLGIGGFTSIAGIEKSEKNFHVVKFDHLSTPSSIHNTLRVESIHSGQRHTIVHIQISESPLLLVGWGTSRHGQLGQLAPLSNLKPPPFTSLPRIIALDDVVSSALGIHHSLFLHTSGQISALGSNRKGQLQLLPSENVRTIGCTWNGSYAVVESNEGWHIYSSGSNSHGQLGLKADPLNADIPNSGVVHFPEILDSKRTSIEIACGSEHILVLSRHVDMEEDRSVQQRVSKLWGWGWNEHGNLGTGNTDDTFLPLKIWSNEPGFISYFEGVHELIGIWAGAGTSWICCLHT
jgi:protein ATS1